MAAASSSSDGPEEEEAYPAAEVAGTVLGCLEHVLAVLAWDASMPVDTWQHCWEEGVLVQLERLEEVVSAAVAMLDSAAAVVEDEEDAGDEWELTAAPGAAF